MNDVDLTNCDREPIHLLGSVQDFGCLLALSSDLVVRHVSRTAADWFDTEAEDLIGRSIIDFLPAVALKRLRHALENLRGSSQVEREFDLEVGSGRRAEMAVHLSNELIIVELEPEEGDDQQDEFLRSAVDRLGSARTVEQILNTSARVIRSLSGFDRVMVYRFLHDGSGEVVAEDKTENLESFHGLRYPPSDIPKQARELYKRNLIRSIADVGSAPSPIVPPLRDDGTPLDLSFSVLRSVSPIHVEYLSNMGVGASMSLSILRGGELWGLVACHHMSPRRLSLRTRSQAEMFAQMLALILESRERAEQVRDERRVQALYGRMMQAVSRSDTPKAAALASLFPQLRRVIDADGIGVFIDDEGARAGAAPTDEEFKALVRFLNMSARGEIYTSHDLANVYPRAADFALRTAGLLAIPLSRDPRDWLVLFRREIKTKVTWAGNPSKPAQLGPNGVRLTPRKSFEAWQEMVAGESAPWTENDRRVAEALRSSILELILKLTDEVANERKRAQERQELLISELNHRVRNMLGLVSSVIRQTRAGHASTEEYVGVLDERIQSLARAHDQITEDNWAPASVRKLIDAEGSAYLNEKPGRLSISGEDVRLAPEAFSTLSLVVHEMMTNSCKYGALCDQSGTVSIDLSREDDGRLVIEWQERDGPPVKPPSRRGFGTTIIQRSIPFDLGGESDIDYHLLGVRARFVIPAGFVHEGQSESGHHSPVARDDGASTLKGHVLIVEDNLLVAIDTEAIVEELGAKSTDVAANVAAALRAINKQRPDFAILDINLGTESSLPVADRLVELGVPFGFASGYGDRAELPEPFADVPRISKPLSVDQFRQFLARFDTQIPSTDDRAPE